MFLFAVTRQSIAGGMDVPDVREVSSGGWVLTAATDGQFSTCRAEGGRVAVSEYPPSGWRGYTRPLLTEAAFTGDGDERPAVVELFKSLLGGRQVYYHLGGGGELYCASHVRLLRQAGVRLEEDAERLPEFFTYRYVTPPRTLFKGIDQLHAGQRLRFEFDGRAWRPAATDGYSPPQPEPGGGDYAERAGAALRGAIASLDADQGRTHFLMSGGTDSSILFKLGQRELGVSQTHSTSYPFEPEDEDVEKQYALTAAEAMGARHRFFAPTTNQFLRGVVESIAAAEEPVVHMQSVLLMLLFRDGLPAGPGTVAVGQGADGAFGLRLHGYVHRLQAKGKRYRRWRPLLGRWPVRAALNLSSRWLKRGGIAYDAGSHVWEPDQPVADPRHVLWWLGVVADPRWVRRRFRATPQDVIANRAAVMAPFQGRSALDLISLLDFFGDVTVTQSIWSKLGEAAGKWVYYPFNDCGVMDCAFAIPWEAKLAEPKKVLRDVARRLGVPEFILTRPKGNFNANAKRWALPGAALEPLVPLAAKFFQVKELRRMQVADAPPAFYTYWTMLTYAVWRRLMIDGEPVERLLGELEQATPGVRSAPPSEAVAGAPAMV